VDGGERGQEDRLDVVFGSVVASGSNGSAVTNFIEFFDL